MLVTRRISLSAASLPGGRMAPGWVLELQGREKAN